MSLMRVIIDGKEKWKWNRDGIPRDTQEEALKDNIQFIKPIEFNDDGYITEKPKRNKRGIDNRNNDKELSSVDD